MKKSLNNFYLPLPYSGFKKTNWHLSQQISSDSSVLDSCALDSYVLDSYILDPTQRISLDSTVLDGGKLPNIQHSTIEDLTEYLEELQLSYLNRQQCLQTQIDLEDLNNAWENELSNVIEINEEMALNSFMEARYFISEQNFLQKQEELINVIQEQQKDISTYVSTLEFPDDPRVYLEDIINSIDPANQPVLLIDARIPDLTPPTSQGCIKSSRGFLPGDSSGGGPGSGGSSGGGGSNWGEDGNWDNEGPPLNYIGFILFGSAIIIIGKIIVDYGSQIVKKNLERLLSSTKKQIDDLKVENNAYISLGRKLPSLFTVLASGPALIILSYLFHPSTLRELTERLAEIVEILAQQVGRFLLQCLPPQLQEAAQHLGHFIEVVGIQLRLFVDQVIFPIVLYCRTLGLLLIKVYFLLKLTSLGMELYKVCTKAVPDSVTVYAQKIISAISSSSLESSLFVFGENFLRAASIFLLPLLPWPNEDIPQVFIVIVKICVLFWLIGPPLNFVYEWLVCYLLNIKAVAQLCSCIAGRWILILVSVNFVRNQATLRRYSIPFGVLLYVFRVYELAMTATPNFLPIQ